ncbi:MAG: LysM peptidoglycan-binding domain-containing protein, partial [Pseudomonadales bacterium]|nr:LysM peptidoglycan-binding domain-containing protein [Pseudomonadales bacterium]
QDWWYDGRRDPQASTIAALDYLQSLHKQFDGDWLLALAAYNTGGANLSRALRRVEPERREFWNLPLALETRSHVPKILALSRLIQNPEDYAVTLSDIPNEDPLIRVEIGSQIDLARVADLVELDTATLQRLNPGYLQWATHPESPQSLAIPVEKAEALRTGLATLDRSEFVTWEHYRIRRGDTLGGIARRLNTTVDVLQVVNKLRGTTIIAGRSLLIPRGTAAVNYTELTPPTLPDSVRPTAVPPSYTVRRGDNLWIIARRFDLRSQEIADHNGLQLDALLQPGQTLDLGYAQALTVAAGSGQADSGRTYRVRRGDSMASIARSFSTELSDLLRWNGLSRNDLIFPGQQIVISAP